MTSSTADRVNRVSRLTLNAASTSAGSMMWWNAWPKSPKIAVQERVDRVEARDAVRRVDARVEAARSREPVELVEAEVERDERDPERRHRDPGERADSQDVVGRPVAAQPRENAERDADDRGEEHRVEGELAVAGMNWPRSWVTAAWVSDDWPRSPCSTWSR